MTSSLTSLSAAKIQANETLEHTIGSRIDTWRSNPAMTTLINDYARYHAILVVIGGLIVCGFAVLSARLWNQFRRSRRTALPDTKPSLPKVSHTKAPERKLYLAAAVASTTVGLLFALIVFANLSNARNPVPGFVMATTHPTPNSFAVDSAVNEWILSGSSDVPAAIEEKVRERLAWQRPKAAISGLLFVVFALASVKTWRSLLQQAQTGRPATLRQTAATIATETTFVSLALLAMVMFIANTQASFAPLSITVLGGS